MTDRIPRLNSLLKEVLSEVIRLEVKNPQVSELTSISEVDITKDLRHAKVYISVIGDDKVRQETLQALQSASGFISSIASKKVTMRYFPALTFYIDRTVEKQMSIDSLLKKIETEKNSRQNGSSS